MGKKKDAKMRKEHLKKYKVNAEYDNDIGLNKIFTYKSGDGFVDQIFHSDDYHSVPIVVSELYLRIDDSKKYPMQIITNPAEPSAIINNEYQVNFVDEVGKQSFFNDLFYFIDELYEVPLKERGTSTNREIKLEDELEYFKERK